MRIIAGRFKGRTLAGPTWGGLRPTSDMLRETLFNILGAAVQGARVLDAYAGTGALGIEAISRGAAFVVFVELDRRARALIGENLRRCGVSEGYAMIPAERALKRRFTAGASFDVILADPPYGEGNLDAAIGRLGQWLAADGLLVLEHARRRRVPHAMAGLVRVRTVESGDSALAFYRPSPQVSRDSRETEAAPALSPGSPEQRSDD
jgi:16S rRNA (guanine966-N2)-methyltransferase